ncbi:MAG: hypothetical protein HLUCCA04_13405 [Oceanicaulis sp. HLUCCA04]|nr:MAG: hypothetical protein HLUCCA04_13405 [Oceanicaulis sp. HLUCCA04]
MPKGPNGERRPADANACAVMVARIATGEVEEKISKPSAKRKSALEGAKARSLALTSERKSEIARKAAKARWKGDDMSLTQPAEKSAQERRLPYPANGLGEPKKAFEDTFRLSTAVKAAVEKRKK